LIKLGIIGCGNIGRFVMENLGREEFQEFSLDVIADVPAAEPLLRELSSIHSCSYTTDPSTLLDRHLDVVMEAANPSVAKRCAPDLLQSSVSMVIMSVGAFVDRAFVEEALRAAVDGNARILIPTGAIAGLDHLKAAKLAGIDEATLTMTKAPKALVGAPHFDRHPVDLFALKEPTVVFEGSAAEAIDGFPSNVNVAVALSLVTLGPGNTKVRVICEPTATRISTQIYARGASGELKVELVNLPSPDNPKTSYQACLSALATLKRFTDRVQIGT
jgi:aspartate dehydrogenase